MTAPAESFVIGNLWFVIESPAHSDFDRHKVLYHKSQIANHN